jgi:SsrA-binding protein
MHKKEILELKFATERSGQTIVPLRVYLNSEHKIKVEIAVAKGKKKYDQRETIKNRDLDRSLQRMLKGN